MYVADGEKVICNLFFNGKDDFFVAQVKGTKKSKMYVFCSKTAIQTIRGSIL